MESCFIEFSLGLDPLYFRLFGVCFFFPRPEIQRLKHFSAQRYFGTKDLVLFLRYGPPICYTGDGHRVLWDPLQSLTQIIRAT